MYNYKEGALLRVLFDLGMFASTISCGIDSIYIYIYIYTIKLSEYHKGQLLVILIIVFMCYPSTNCFTQGSCSICSNFQN